RRPHAPVPRDADVLVVEAGRAHDVHSALATGLRHQRGVTPQVDRARVDPRAQAEGGQLLHALDGQREGRVAIVTVGRVEIVAGVADADVLVDEGRPEFSRVDRSEDGLDGRHTRT